MPPHRIKMLWRPAEKVALLGKLLSATLLMTPRDKPLRAKLKQALLDESSIRRELLLLEQDRTKKRLDKIQSQLDNIESNAQRMAERQIKQLLEGPKKTSAEKASAKQVN